MNTFISVILPCYNSEKHLRQAIHSVLDQDYEDFEIIFVDGGSTDDTLRIINEYKVKYPLKMSYTSEKDKGIYDAINKGLLRTRGDLIVVLGSDDWIEEGAFKRVSEVYNGNDVIIFGMVRFIKNENQEYGISLYNAIALEDMIIMNHQTCYISKSVYEKIGNYDLKYISNSDKDFLLRCYYSKVVEFVPISKILANFRLGGMSSSIHFANDENKLRYKYKHINTLTYLSRNTKLTIRLLVYRLRKSLKSK